MGRRHPSTSPSLRRGAVRFYCRFHANMGMQGAFFFNEGDTVVTGTTGG